MKKILLVLSILVFVGVAVYKFIPKATNSSSSPSAIQVVPQTIIRNAAGSVDYYVYIHNQDSDTLKEHTAVYSYSYWAGIDFGSENVEYAKNDAVILPRAKVLSIDEESEPINLVSKGIISYNDVYTPIKSAVSKMAADFARRSDVTERSEEYIIDMLGSMNDTKTFVMSDKQKESSTHFKFPFSPLEIDYYPNLLNRKYTFIVDTTQFNLWEVTAHDIEKNVDVFSIQYDMPWENTFSSTLDRIKSDYGKEKTFYYIADPINPKEKLLVASQDYADFFIGGKTYSSYMWIDDDQSIATTYFPDMMYILSCIHETRNDNSSEYHSWIDCYNSAIDYINKGDFFSAKRTMADVKSLQKGSLSYDEEYLQTLIDVLNGDKWIIDKTSDETLNGAIDIYNTIVKYHGEGLKDSREKRQKFFDSVDESYKEVKGLLARYYLNNRYFDVTDQRTYVDYLTSNGLQLDEEQLGLMNNAQFLDYMTNALYKSSRDEFGDYTKDEFDEIIKVQNYDAVDGVRVIKYLGKGGKEDYLKDVDQAIKQLKKAKVTIDSSNVPMLIVLFLQDRNVILDPDRDALIFTRNSVSYVGNYTGLNSQNVITKTYENVDVATKNKVKFSSSKQYEVKSETLYNMVKSLHDTFNRNNDNAVDRSVEKGLTNYIIDLINNRIGRGVITYRK